VSSVLSLVFSYWRGAVEDEESVEDDWSSVICAESALLFAEMRLHGRSKSE